MNQPVWSWLPGPASLGAAVRDARKRRGLQQGDLAERCGVARMTISRMERGEAVAMDTALRALSEVGMSLVAVPMNARVTVTDG
ncbi:helix-turn-helix transcriptional regulator [Mycobacterium koreense]|uniref:Transcriptional regulator n=1 Tax=Mycolicibacillus koreensis TaxID=1069220 RepID=A0AA91PG66_9MYCO|nr:helix-turn-helix transcriptional regulator [Mycolicibacillus koreensis]MCV7247676.1 helix-turn-helix transcriptional regulator [Mycolicibacillus koreensis]OSC34788.1 transcriptional regulator [Mycolicibacillus koreensis]